MEEKITPEMLHDIHVKEQMLDNKLILVKKIRNAAFFLIIGVVFLTIVMIGLYATGIL